MLVLGIETSGLAGSVAVVRDQECLAERELNQAGRRHAQSLVLEIGDVLRSLGLSPRDVECVAVSRGPGSFTGLRVGMVCAKTFAYAAGCRFVAVDTFAAIAETVQKDIQRVTVIEDAQRNDLFAGDYQRHKVNQWKQLSSIRIVSVADFLRDRLDSEFVVGPGIKKLDPGLVNLRWLSDQAIYRARASTIATLGQLQLNSGDVPASDTDFWTASPFYLRLSAAEEKRVGVGNAGS